MGRICLKARCPQHREGSSRLWWPVPPRASWSRNWPGCCIISQTVQGLVLEGLVVREPSEKDRRAVSIRMTDKGMERYRYHHDKINGILDHLLRDVPAEDRATFERVLAIALEEGKKLRAAQMQGAGK